MKLLIDQNISHRIIFKISSYPFELFHVRDFGFSKANEFEIFSFAKQSGFNAIITQDDDFFRLVQLYGQPPKIIRMKLGNSRTEKMANVLQDKADEIQFFLSQSDLEFLEIYGFDKLQ